MKVINLSHLIFSTVQQLHEQPPQLIGVVLSLMVLFVHHNTFSIFETIATPIVTDENAVFTDTLNYYSFFSNSLFLVMGLASFFAFLIFSRFHNIDGINIVSDRAFVLANLMLGILGSLMLIDYKAR